jgi:hypothetical protein
MRKKAPPSEAGIGDTTWLMSQTGWTHDKVARLCRTGRVQGAFQSQPNTKGSLWYFRKTTTLAWLGSLEIKKMSADQLIGQKSQPLAIGWAHLGIPEFY